VTTTTRRVPIQTRVFDESGNITRTWALFFESLNAAVDSSVGAVITLHVDGTLAIGSEMAPIAALLSSRRPTAVSAFVTEPSVGDDIVISITADGVEWLELTITEGDVSVSAAAADIVSAGALPANKPIGLDITGVGIGTPSFPGANLTVILYF